MVNHNPSSTKINSLFRILVISLLNKHPMSGYDIIKSLEEQTGSKPSHGKIYPFLHDLLSRGYVDKISSKSNEPRPKVTYQLTEFGKNELYNIYQQLEFLFINFLETCENCECRFYSAKNVINNSGI